MQKNKIEYDQIINKIDKLTFDSLLDTIIPERVDGKCLLQKKWNLRNIWLKLILVPEKKLDPNWKI